MTNATRFPSTEELRWWVDNLPPTDQLRAEMAAATPERRVSIGYRLRDAEQRDEIAASRPDSCRLPGRNSGCLGTGYVYDTTRFDIQGNAETIYCTCPEGVAAHEEHDAERSRAQEKRRATLRVDAGFPWRVHELLNSRGWEGFARHHPELAAELQRREDVEESLYIWGPYGTGKTVLACLLACQCIDQNLTRVAFVTVPALLDEIRGTFNSDGVSRRREEADLTETVRTQGLLILDDLGAERPTEWVQERLFNIINHRYDQLLPTIFTSNLGIEELSGRLGERIAWRIVEMTRRIKLAGVNLRDPRKS